MPFAFCMSSSNGASVLCRLPLGIVEVGGNRDHGLGDAGPEKLLGILSDLGEDHGRDLRRLVRFPVDPDRPVGPHVALDGEDGPIRIHRGLPAGDVSHELLSLLREGNHRGRGSSPLAPEGMMTGSPFSTTAAQLFVVPGSMPMIVLMCSPFC